MTKIDWQWAIGILVAVAAILLPLIFSKKNMSQSQEQNIDGKGSQKQSQKMEG